MDRLKHAVAKSQELADAPLSWVYFIQCEEFTKIGFARSVSARLAHYAVHNPFPLNLLASFSTRRVKADEDLIHTAFEAYHVRGEWFKLPERVVKWIKDNKKTLNVEGLIQQALA